MNLERDGTGWPILGDPMATVRNLLMLKCDRDIVFCFQDPLS